MDGPAATISAVVAVRNGAAHVGAALDSILAQTRAPDEVIVVDDGSTDGTLDVVRGFGARVRVVARPVPGGAAAARNAGIDASGGDLIAFLDHDDLWCTDKLERQAAVLDAEPDVDLVFGHTRQFRSPELTPEAAARLACDERVQPSTLISCLLARRSAFARVGPLRDVSVDFVDWLLRAQEARLSIRIVDALVTLRRIHPQSMSLTDPRVRRDYLRVLKASLDRRRGGADG